MNKTTIWVGIAIIIALGLGWWAYTAMQQPAPTDETGQEEVAGAQDEFIDDSKDGAAAVSAYTISYSDTGFSPSTLTVPVGTTVTFVNKGTIEMWVGSDEHPSHTGYDGTSKDTHCVDGVATGGSFDQCGVGSTYSFTFTKAGTWGYHNHRESDHHGSIVVTE